MDFTLAFEVATDADAQATVLLRVHDTGRSRLQGPRVTLPANPVAGAWRRIEIVAEGRRVTLAVDGDVLARADVSQFVGHVGFQVEKGAARFRQVTMAPIDQPFAVPAEVLKTDDLKARGGQLPKLKGKSSTEIHSAAGMRVKVQGTVRLEVLVLADGTVGLVRLVRSLDRILTCRRSESQGVDVYSDAKAVAALIEVNFEFEARLVERFGVIRGWCGLRRGARF